MTALFQSQVAVIVQVSLGALHGTHSIAGRSKGDLKKASEPFYCSTLFVCESVEELDDNSEPIGSKINK